MNTPATLKGIVMKGRGLGTQLGIPTANVLISRDVLEELEPGVYASIVHLDEARLPSATHIGKNSTLGDTEPKCETHIIKYHGNLYGQELRIDLIKKLRDTKKFDSLDDMVNAIEQDIAQAQELLQNYDEIDNV